MNAYKKTNKRRMNLYSSIEVTPVHVSFLFLSHRIRPVFKKKERTICLCKHLIFRSILFFCKYSFVLLCFSSSSLFRMSCDYDKISILSLKIFSKVRRFFFSSFTFHVNHFLIGYSTVRCCFSFTKTIYE